MTVSKSERVIAWLAAVILLAAAGCTNSEVIGTSTGSVRLTVEAQGGAGRFELGVLNISQIALQPVDPVTQDALGDELIGLLVRPLEIDLNNPEIVSFNVGAPPGSTMALTEGTYAVRSARVFQFTFCDRTGPYEGDCIDKVVSLSRSSGVCTSQPSVTVVEYSPSPILELSATGDAELRLTISDVPALIDVFAGRFTNCVGPPPGLGAGTYSPPFSNQLDDILVIGQIQ